MKEPSLQSEVPPAADFLRALRAAQGDVLGDMVRDTGIAEGMRVLDIGCGDGFFMRRIARLIGPSGQVVGLDIDGRALRAAAANCRKLGVPYALVEGHSSALPFPDRSFDACFSALSFFDFSDPVSVVSSMCRVTRPGGVVAVIEHDYNHQALFPFPAGLELAVEQALARAAREAVGATGRFYAARNLPLWLSEAGLADVTRRSYTRDLSFPLSTAERRYIDVFLREIWQHARPYLGERERALMRAWYRGETERPSPDMPGFTVTFFHFLTTGRISPG
ncbi:MAG TPA: class I SAM-dependent methyltransferase [Polyangiaceae bacterium]